MTKKEITLTLTETELKNLWGYCQDRKEVLVKLLENNEEWYQKYRIEDQNELNSIIALQTKLVKEHLKNFS